MSPSRRRPREPCCHPQPQLQPRHTCAAKTLASDPAPFSPSESRQALNLAMARRFFVVGGLACLVGAVAIGLQPMQRSPATTLALVAACMAMSLAFALAHWNAPALEPRRAVLGMSWACCALVGLVAWGTQLGVHAIALGFFSLIVCALTVLAGRGHAALLAAACGAVIVGLAWAEASGRLPVTQAVAAMPLSQPVTFQLILLCAGWSLGVMLTRMASESRRQVDERERRISALLRIGVDWYWELDRHFRFTHISDNPKSGSYIDSRSRLGHAPWELPGLGMSDSQLAAHRADLEAHRPFSGTLARRRDAQGRLRFVSISGEPRFGADHEFLGYVGVGRDVTNEVMAQQATAAVETRYRELFERSPSPFILHRDRVVIDANAAAARTFGFDSREAMAGFDITELYTEGESRDLCRVRIAELERLPVGEGLPVADYKLQSLTGRKLSVQGTGVRVDTAEGPAILSIYHDVSTRTAAEVALRRSETMLSHLFATSPDSITLSELASGRFTLVNDSFVRLSGFTRDELIGKTSLEVGIWNDPRDRAAMVDEVSKNRRMSGRPVVLKTKSGPGVPVLLAAARFEMDGRDYVVSNLRDISQTERVRLEHTAIFQNAAIGIALTRDRHFVQTNPLFERMFGWPVGELVGQPGRVVWKDDDDYAQISRSIGPVLSAGQPLELEHEFRRRDGSLFWCRAHVQVVNPGDPSQGGTIWIFEDITGRREIELALSAARDAAEAASNAKSAFLANTSHEIRTPLNGLLGLARLAMHSDLDEARRQLYLRQIVDSAQSLSAIISDILDLSKIEAGKITLEAVPFELRATLQAVVLAYQPLAQAKDLSLSLNVQPEVPHSVRGDPLRVRQILSNFITNALKFTEHGSVEVRATMTRDGALRISVTDTGVGIGAETQARLFTPFMQADTSTTRRYGGTGLGLSICRELVLLMGGRLGVDSRVGEGSRFWAELPLPEAERGPPTPDTDWGRAEPFDGVRVLVVEDNPVNMMIVVAMLEQWGIEVVQAVDGRSALIEVERSVSEGRPLALVLMDVQMPEMSGHETARLLRERHDAQALPIVALTAAALVSEREEALASGMNDFMTKPIDVKLLRATLLRYAARIG